MKKVRDCSCSGPAQAVSLRIVDEMLLLLFSVICTMSPASSLQMPVRFTSGALPVWADDFMGVSLRDHILFPTEAVPKRTTNKNEIATALRAKEEPSDN